MNLYVSGPGAGDLAQLANDQLRVHILGERFGDASAVKMCYGAFNKGTQGLMLETLMAAQRLGVYEELEKQLLSSRADQYNALLDALPLLPPKAYRWVPEMLEIARTFEGVGMTPRIFQGEADMFELSPKVTATTHPTMLSLLKADGEVASLPAVRHNDAADLWSVRFAGRSQGKPAELVVEVVVVGHFPE